jgi:hypothetical protein
MRDSRTYAPERLESLQPAASDEHRGRLVRDCEEENGPVLALETQRLPHCDRARGRAVEAAEDAVDELGLARSCVHPRGPGADPASMTSSDRKSRPAPHNRGNATCILISARSRLARGASRKELDRALEAEAERLLDGDMQEAELL